MLKSVERDTLGSEEVPKKERPITITGARSTMASFINKLAHSQNYQCKVLESKLYN